MKKIKFILLFICSVMLTTSCDYLDIAPTEVSSEEEIFSDIKTVFYQVPIFILIRWSVI